ncbi:MAG TPA: DNA methyltransferase [Gemmatimonadales bacterium]
MLTLRHAARLLAGADSMDGIAALGRALGFEAVALPVGSDLAADVGLPAECARLAIVPGSGLLRLMLVQGTSEMPLQATVERVARRLAARAPHPLWCVIGMHARSTDVVIAAWSGDRSPPRVAALAVRRDRLVDSDAETVRALAAAHAGDDVATHAGWMEVLGRGSLTRRFYRELERTVGALADALEPRGSRLDAVARRELALLHVSRLLFLSFVQAKGWLDGDAAYLGRGFVRCMESGGNYHGRVLLPLFFGTLNTPPARRAPTARALGRIPFLNGGLFARTALERRAGGARFPDHALAPLFDRLLARYRFTAREDRLTWSEAAVDPEMLGHAFESLMDAGARRASGAFYTPQALVAHVTRLGLAEALAGGDVAREVVECALRDGEAPLDADPSRARELLCRIRALRLLDPACGSGAFLVHALEALSALARRVGDARPVSTVRRELLSSCIFGVDVNPTAVWLAELRLWLSVVIDSAETDALRVAPLPNLDRNVRVGDALLGGSFDGGAAGRGHGAAGACHVSRLRQRYARATGASKHALARRMEREERLAALRDLDSRLQSLAAHRRDLIACARGADLFGARRGLGRDERRRLEELRRESRSLQARRRSVAAGAGLPFAFRTHFPDVATSGFGLVLGNPPWVRPHNVPSADRRLLQREFASVRDAAWMAGAVGAGAGRGFATQADLAAPFVERSLSLLAPAGAAALVLPAKLWRSLSGGGVRRILAERASVRRVEDWTRSRHCFDAAVYPSVLVAAGAPADVDTDVADVAIAEETRCGRRCWHGRASAMRYDDDPASPWLMAPPEVRRAFDLLSDSGTSLVRSGLERPLLGVKCGCNEAFVVRPDASGARALRPFLRPLLRGSTLEPWRAPDPGERLLWTHDDDGAPLDEPPAAVLRHLSPWRARLARRTDARGSLPWWSLFRTESARADRPRVVWGDIGRAPRAALLAAGDATVPLNSCSYAGVGVRAGRSFLPRAVAGSPPRGVTEAVPRRGTGPPSVQAPRSRHHRGRRDRISALLPRAVGAPSSLCPRSAPLVEDVTTIHRQWWQRQRGEVRWAGRDRVYAGRPHREMPLVQLFGSPPRTSDRGAARCRV